MPRLRDTRTGVVVDVDDATATVLGGAYEPVERQQQKATAPRRRVADKSDDKR